MRRYSYAIYQEWQQHIVSATATTAANVEKARAEAGVARYNSFMSINLTAEASAAASAQLATDCVGAVSPDILARLQAQAQKDIEAQRIRDERGGCPVGQHEIIGGWCRPDHPAP